MVSIAAERRKTPTNLFMRADLIRRARAMKLNLSELLEEALERAVRESEREDWLAKNGGAIRAYNARVQARGVFSDRWRRF